MLIIRFWSSMRAGEVRLLDHQAAELDTSRAGVVRAMLRFALENETQFRHWLKETDGKVLLDLEGNGRSGTRKS